MVEIEKDLCNPGTLRDAIAEVFSSMIFMEISPGGAAIEEKINEKPAVLGTISFRGVFDGSLSICCSMDCAKEITMNLLAFEDEEEMQASDIPDAIGEVANMTMGSLKTRLYDRLGEINVSVPVVVSGASMVNELRAGEVKLSSTVGVAERFCLQVNLVYQFTGESQ